MLVTGQRLLVRAEPMIHVVRLLMRPCSQVLVIRSHVLANDRSQVIMVQARNMAFCQRPNVSLVGGVCLLPASCCEALGGERCTCHGTGGHAPALLPASAATCSWSAVC